VVEVSDSHPFFDRAEQARRGRVGGLKTAYLHDTRETTANARAASAASLRERLLREIDPENRLPQDQREVRLARARRAHFIQLSMKAAAARRNTAARRRPPTGVSR
jgi:hypothetical protein